MTVARETPGSSGGFAAATVGGGIGRGAKPPSEENHMALEADRVICF
jgi:hypothetical protein